MLGTLLDLQVDRIAHGGVAVARHDGRVVFVADAIPGERVRARVTDASKDRFWRADTVEVLDASPDRREHVWAEASVDRDPAERPGGAEFGHIRIERQRALKGEVLADALSRMGGVELAPEVRAVDAELAPGVDGELGTGWRTRVRLHVDEEGRVGPYAARSRRVIPVASLPLAAAELAALAPLGAPMPGAGAIDLVLPSTGEAQLVTHEAAAEPAQRGERGQRDRRGRRGGARRPQPARQAAPVDTVVVEELVAGRRFQVDRGGFWQVHRGAAATLSGAVQRAIDVERFDPRAANLDLYGGVGLLAAAVGDRFGGATRITTVEAEPRATMHAGENLAEWVGAQAVTARVDRYLAELVATAGGAERASLAGGTVVLDPPRAGAGREVVDRLAELGPAQIVYVACDPVALARDVALFRAHGYEPEQVEAFDLFPNTHHLEAVARLAR
ncbi:class I SAM-dependent RNA methyltransferase [Agromyces mediolanus]|uniref:class I SAM-dependent RNA methyltransferase n=1 Tax=Agromyces mediolanus TaxID=41986 RepID=UPI00203F31A2|nr:TRAM domain-containing protein [Agromyces mediolanus]MCM3656504.1 class I SAM-dependent RNA methyltransferase [Agromyces mediolanus]